MSQLAVGALFADHRIEGYINRGGMGVVYRATQLGARDRHGQRATIRQVALKVIAPEHVKDVEFRERFIRESRLAASIEHPHVIPIYRADEEDGLLFISMKLVAGTDLSAVIARDGRISATRMSAILAQIADGLDAAHEQGLVHRDIKPGNVLLEEGPHGDHAFVSDFGLAKLANAEEGLTATGMFVGTVDYMAPEQLRDLPIDARTDVYALGCLLHHALTGRVPYPELNHTAKIFAHVMEPVAMASGICDDVPVAVAQVTARAMAKEPDDRYSSAGELAEAFEAALAESAPPRLAQPRGTETVVAKSTPVTVPGPAPELGPPPEPVAEPAAPPAVAPAQPILAGWGRRAWALFLDFTIIGFASGIVAGLVGDGGEAAPLVVVVVVASVYHLALMTRAGARNGQTLGKKAARIRVVQVSGRPVGVGVVLAREIAVKTLVTRLLPLVVLLANPLLFVPAAGLAVLDYLWPLWDPQNRAIHDMVAATRVVVE